jgi:hypothetical protein
MFRYVRRLWCRKGQRKEVRAPTVTTIKDRRATSPWRSHREEGVFLLKLEDFFADQKGAYGGKIVSPMISSQSLTLFLKLKPFRFAFFQHDTGVLQRFHASQSGKRGDVARAYAGGEPSALVHADVDWKWLAC